MIFLDTSACIDILRGSCTLENFHVRFRSGTFAISSPTIFELHNGVYKLKYLKKHKAPKFFAEMKKDLDDLV